MPLNKETQPHINMLNIRIQNTHFIYWSFNMKPTHIYKEVIFWKVYWL